MYTRFRPGKVWLDQNGKKIQAHGGSVLYRNGTYYWYGENKEGITGMATGVKCKNWHFGVRLYASHDLYNWEDKGVIMLDTSDMGSPFYPENIMDRPHILFHEKSGLFVLWAKCSRGTFDSCFFAVCVSEDIEKPFRFVCENDCTPFRAGDFDLFQANEQAYIVYENPHSEMICQTLTDDYLHLSREYSRHLPVSGPPFAREAPCYFARGGRKFLISSGTTGYYPNETQTHELTDGVHKNWKTLGKTCFGDREKNSFHAQFSSVFAHPEIADFYIALGDRWLTDLPVDLPDMNDLFYRMCNRNAKPLPENYDLAALSEECTSDARYVWLPILFNDQGEPYIKWFDAWTVEDVLEGRLK